jgi:hypothetical protein
VDDEGVDVRCSPARSVALSSGVWDGCKVNAGPLEMNWRGRETERSDDVPRREPARPDRELLAERFERFAAA